MTYAEIENAARTLLQDDKTPYRFAAVEVYGYVNSCVKTLLSVRPSAFFVSGRFPTSAASMEPIAPETVVASSGAVNLPAPAGDRYLDAFAYYVAAKCLERDDSDTGNAALAATYMQNFSQYAKL